MLLKWRLLVSSLVLNYSNKQRFSFIQNNIKKPRLCDLSSLKNATNIALILISFNENPLFSFLLLNNFFLTCPHTANYQIDSLYLHYDSQQHLNIKFQEYLGSSDVVLS